MKSKQPCNRLAMLAVKADHLRWICIKTTSVGNENGDENELRGKNRCVTR